LHGGQEKAEEGATGHRSLVSVLFAAKSAADFNSATPSSEVDCSISICSARSAAAAATATLAAQIRLFLI